MIVLPVTLCAAAAAAIISIWLGLRIGQIRAAQNVIHGDGGVPLLTRRMRAQLNFVEYTPFVLILVAAIELSASGRAWLPIAVAIYMLGRICHALGMDADGPHVLRKIGVLVTLFTLLALATMAILIATGRA